MPDRRHSVPRRTDRWPRPHPRRLTRRSRRHPASLTTTGLIPMEGSPNMSRNWKGIPGRKAGDTPNTKPEWAEGLSIFDPVFLGLDETGVPVHVELTYRNLLVG